MRGQAVNAGRRENSFVSAKMMRATDTMCYDNHARYVTHTEGPVADLHRP